MSKKIDVLFIILILILTGFAGWYGNDVWRAYNLQRDIDGLYLKANGWNKAFETAKEYDYLGDWVCVNIRGMDIDTAYRTCRHEVSHEIFAEYCEESDRTLEGCMGVVQ